MNMRLFGAATIAGALFAADVLAHNVRMNSNLSPYLNLTRTEFQLNDSFPVYHKLIRPQLEQRNWRIQSPNTAAPRRPNAHHRPVFSPYLHLSRKNVNRLFPIYQTVIRPTVERQNHSFHLRHDELPIDRGRKAFVNRPPNRSRVTSDFRVPQLNGGPQPRSTTGFDRTTISNFTPSEPFLLPRY